MREIDGIPLLIAEELLDEGIVVAFTTRVGGVSASPYDSLNLAFHVGDRPECVIENRERVCRALRLESNFLTCAEQVHGSDVVIVDELKRAGGARSKASAIQGADALITALPETPLAIFTADCVPIALVDPRKRLIASVHAGWRGTIAKIAEVAVSMMNELGANPGNILAFLGPAIGPCCYEVGNEIGRRFQKEFGPIATQVAGHIDLQAANRALLQKAGLHKDKITETNRCTSSRNDLFFSYRADGKVTGRQGVIVALQRRF